MTPWKTRAKEIIFSRLPYLEVSQQTVELPNGTVLDDFYQVHLQSFATIVPVLEDGRILALRSYKHGPGRVCLSVPAGFIDTGETPLQGAQRELLEETGLVSEDWLHLGTYVDNGNRKGCEGHYFLARGCRQIAEPDSGDHEEMQRLTVTASELDQALAEGAFGVVHQAANWAFARMHLTG